MSGAPSAGAEIVNTTQLHAAYELNGLSGFVGFLSAIKNSGTVRVDEWSSTVWRRTLTDGIWAGWSARFEGAFTPGQQDIGRYPVGRFWKIELFNPQGVKLVTWTLGGGGMLNTDQIANLVNEFAKADYVYGSDNNDTVRAAGGDDWIEGKFGNDLLYGGTGADTIEGGAGDDQVYGEDNADRLVDGDGFDTLDGGAGDDTIVAGSGQDVYIGGGGFDVLDFSASPWTLFIDLRREDLQDTNQGAFRDQILGVEGVIGTTGPDSMQGSIRADMLDGRGSNDALHGNGDNDTLKGGDGDDVLWGGQGADRMEGGAGFDTASYTTSLSPVSVFMGQPGAGSWDGYGDTFDSIERLQLTLLSDTGAGDGAANEIWGEAGDDVLFGGGGDDWLKGGDGDDFLSGEAGADRLEGGAGDDEILIFNGVDTISTGAGADLIVIGVNDGPAGAPVVVTDFTPGVDRLTIQIGAAELHFAGSNVEVRWDRDEDGVQESVVRILGSRIEGGDLTTHPTLRLISDVGAHWMVGGLAEDVLVGGGGGDTMFGGGGPDRFLLAPGDSSAAAPDVLRDFETGVDRIDVSALGLAGAAYVLIHASAAGSVLLIDADANGGFETRVLLSTALDARDLVGSGVGVSVVGDGADQFLFGDIHADALNGAGGADVVEGGGGGDSLYGEAGDDALLGEAGNDYVYGGSGHDTMWGGTGDDALLGEGGDDQLIGEDGADLIYGGDGGDLLFGQEGADVLVGQEGADSVEGGAGDDLLFGDSVVTIGADQLFGGAGADTLYGGSQDDYLWGDDGADVLVGEAGGDLLHGGWGADLLVGGAGGDRFLFTQLADSTLAAADLIVDFNPFEDLIDLSMIDANILISGDQAFTFVTSFTGAAGQARLTYDAVSGRTLFRGDVDGDGVGDVVLLLNGDASGSAGWLL